jgi:amidophosphoribosyltransferase
LQVRSCGILGIFTYDGWAASEIYEGLQMLQHRGQDSAGIVSFDGQKFREHKVSFHSLFPRQNFLRAGSPS